MGSFKPLFAGGATVGTSLSRAACRVSVVVASQHAANSIPATSRTSSRLPLFCATRRVVVIFANGGSVDSDRLLLRGSRGGKLGQNDIRKTPRDGKKGGRNLT